MLVLMLVMYIGDTTVVCVVYAGHVVDVVDVVHVDVMIVVVVVGVGYCAVVDVVVFC